MSSSPSASGVDVSGVKDAATAQATGLACVTRGEHADAVVWFTRSLELARGVESKSAEMSESESRESKHSIIISLYASRAQARQHMGSLRDAVGDYTAALDLLLIDAAAAPGVFDVSNVTLARGRCKLQLEEYAAACEDFSAALRANSSSRAASEALRDAKRLAKQHARECERDDDAKKKSSSSDDFGMRPGFVRPGLPQFENRGKSGAAF